MLNKLLNIDISLITFIIVMLFGIIFYFEAFDGLLFSDDFSYAFYAYKVSAGSFEWINDIFGHRFGVFLPVAALYKIFGVNDYTTTVWPFICYAGILITLFLVFHKKDKVISSVALILSALSFYPILFSNKLFPDVIVSFFSLLSVLVIIKRNNSYKIVMAMLFAAVFFYGFLVKETILYLIPFIFLIFLKDIINKREMMFWIFSLFFLLAFSIIYFWLYYEMARNIFYRFEVIHEGHYISGGSYFDKPFKLLISRLTFEPLLMLLSTELIIPIIIALPLFFNFIKLTQTEKEWGLSALILLLTFWVGTTSLKFYNPIVLNGRMFIMIVPLWSIVAGISLSKFKQDIFLAISFLILSVMSVYFLSNYKLGLIYLLIILFFLFLYFKRKKQHSFYILILLFILLIHPLNTIYKTSDKNFETLKYVFSNKLSTLKEETTLITDPLIKHSYLYFTKFVPPENLKVISYKGFVNQKDSIQGQVYFLVDWKNLEELGAMNYSIPSWFMDASNKKVILNTRGVVFYKSANESLNK